jgi:hypothetical protein
VNFLDTIVNEKANETDLQIRGNAGLFRIKFDLGQDIRILKVYQVVSKDKLKQVKDFKYNKKTKILFAETHLSYFGSVRFLVKWV